MPNQRGMSLTIFGAISVYGIINLSVRMPKATTTKKRKTPGGKQTTSTIYEGTKSAHFRTFVSKLMDQLDERDMKGFNLVLDNASIHNVATLVEERGYQCIHLPPYSPFLNPIEEFWAKIKAGCRRQRLREVETITQRIYDSASLVTHQDLNGWIEHSISFFPLNNKDQKL